MNVLFYAPFNSRSRDTESVMEAFVKQGKKVFLLTQANEGPYHEQCKKMGVLTYAKPFEKRNPAIYFLKHAFFLWQFCIQHKIDVVYAHLETAALPAVLIQYFVKSKVVACRHIIDEAYLFKNRNFILLNKIVYRIARHVLVVSQRSKDFMIEKEGIRASKIKIIRLAYNFHLYAPVNQEEVQRIKNEYSSSMLLLCACRLVAPKRPLVAVQVAEELVKKQLDLKLLLLGTGPEEKLLKSYVVQHGLEKQIHILGFKSNIVDYLSACDCLIHPSLLDSSSVIIKEAGLQKKAVIACHGIGDVDEYLKHNKNALLVSQEDTINEMITLLEQYRNNRVLLDEIGSELEKDVHNRFSIESIITDYDHFHQQLKIN